MKNVVTISDLLCEINSTYPVSMTIMENGLQSTITEANSSYFALLVDLWKNGLYNDDINTMIAHLNDLMKK
jgi:hypothetical protein